MKGPIKPNKHQRLVRFSVAMPVSIELLVGTNDDAPSEDSDWEILTILNVSCEATVRTVTESMHGSDFEALASLAASTKDVQS